ncbi:MAG: hypothetical protein IIY39_03265 [Firmicutes bacterium]|nr:hypothetical protein [Bacillota bacterium]
MSEEERSTGRKPVRSVTFYLLILFLAALFLLVLAFFMQQRQAFQDLNQTVAKSQNITELQLANQKLTFQLEEATRQADRDEAQLKDAQTQADQAQKQADALEWLRQIEAATRSSYPRSKELIEAFEKTELKKYLPEESVVEGGTSPAETYQNLYAMLF